MSAFGTFQTSRDVRLESVMRTKRKYASAYDLPSGVSRITFRRLIFAA
jgi:hypothetical protein